MSISLSSHPNWKPVENQLKTSWKFSCKPVENSPLWYISHIRKYKQINIFNIFICLYLLLCVIYHRGEFSTGLQLNFQLVFNWFSTGTKPKESFAKQSYHCARACWRRRGHHVLQARARWPRVNATRGRLTFVIAECSQRSRTSQQVHDKSHANDFQQQNHKSDL